MTQRLLFFSGYAFFAFVLANILAFKLGGDTGVWQLIGLSYAMSTLVALVFATILPLSYCTTLKALGLALSGSVLVFLLPYP